mmetsp:Transcript_6632/g.11707  ORF Transcript_6632/g.11707 Transcript_6632/m.11707 type:complete len:81 (-) Transcript_6632:788-1030(-)
MLTNGPEEGQRATVLGRNADGHWRLRITHRQVSNQGTVKEFGEVRLLGSWWADCASKGTVEQIPVVTVPRSNPAEAGDAA